MRAVWVYCIDYDGCGMAGQWPAVLHCGHRCTRPSHHSPPLTPSTSTRHIRHQADQTQHRSKAISCFYHIMSHAWPHIQVLYLSLSSTDCKSTIWRQFEIGSPLLIYTRPNDWIARWSLNYHHRSSLPLPNLCSFNLRIWYKYETVFLVSGV